VRKISSYDRKLQEILTLCATRISFNDRRPRKLLIPVIGNFHFMTEPTVLRRLLLQPLWVLLCVLVSCGSTLAKGKFSTETQRTQREFDWDITTLLAD